MRESNKQRYLDAVRHIESREIPFQENIIDPVHKKAILGRDCISPADQVELNRRVGNDMIYQFFLWEFGRKIVFDEVGRKHYTGGTVTSSYDLEEIEYPDLGKTANHLDELFSNLDGSNLGVICAVNHAPRVTTISMGYEEYSICLLENPQFIHELQKRLYDYTIRELELLLEYPVDVILVPVDVCMNTGLMYSPAMLDEFEYPLLKQVIDRVKQAGRFVCVHMDGKMMSLIPDLIRLGVDIINPIEPCDGQSIFEIKTLFGDQITLQGNIDVSSTLIKGTPEKIRKDVQEHIDKLAQGGGYVVASSHDIPEEVPLENFLAMRDAVHEYHFGD